MEMRHLKLVLEVASAGSLRAATKTLFVTQPALSHQLREIETHLGTPIFWRSKKKMTLTPAGKILHEGAAIILDELIRIEKKVGSLVSGDTGEIKICVECYTCYQWLPVLINGFQSFPNIRFQIITEASSDLESYFRGRKLDVAIVNKKLKGPIDHRPIFKDELLVVVEKNHPLAERTWIKPQDFAKETLITFTHTLPVENFSWYSALLVPEGIAPQKTLRMQLTEGIMEMVKTGLGITVMPKWLTPPYLTSNQLVALPLTKDGFFRQWYAATPSAGNQTGQAMPQYLSQFIEHMSQFKP